MQEYIQGFSDSPPSEYIDYLVCTLLHIPPSQIDGERDTMLKIFLAARSFENEKRAQDSETNKAKQQFYNGSF